MVSNRRFGEMLRLGMVLLLSAAVLTGCAETAVHTKLFKRTPTELDTPTASEFRGSPYSIELSRSASEAWATTLDQAGQMYWILDVEAGDYVVVLMEMATLPNSKVAEFPMAARFQKTQKDRCLVQVVPLECSWLGLPESALPVYERKQAEQAMSLCRIVQAYVDPEARWPWLLASK